MIKNILLTLLSIVLFSNDVFAAQTSSAVDYQALLNQEQTMVKDVKLPTAIDSVVYYSDEGSFINCRFYIGHCRYRVFSHDPSNYSDMGKNTNLKKFDFRYAHLVPLPDEEDLQFTVTPPYENRFQTNLMYNNATLEGLHDRSFPGIDVSYGNYFMGNGCDEVSGRFKVKEYVINGDQKNIAVDFEAHCENAAPALYGSVRYHSFAPLVSNPAAIIDGKLVVPLAQIQNKQGADGYFSLVMHETNPGLYAVDAVTPANRMDPDNINIAAAYNDERGVEAFIIPSVIKKQADGTVEEYEMRFASNPVELKVGDYLQLTEMNKIR